jgi:hypothetical protein
MVSVVHLNRRLKQESSGTGNDVRVEFASLASPIFDRSVFPFGDLNARPALSQSLRVMTPPISSHLQSLVLLESEMQS